LSVEAAVHQRVLPGAAERVLPGAAERVFKRRFARRSSGSKKPQAFLLRAFAVSG